MNRRLGSSFVIALALLLPRFADAADPAGTARTVESLLRELSASGVDVIYSSVLVPPDLLVPAEVSSGDPLTALRQALASHHLELRQIAPGRFVVARPAEDDAPATQEPMPEVSVYASRYAIEGRSLGVTQTMGNSEIESVPGSSDDALRALKALPGLASNVSARPYIRGSLSEDVLVRYDGITLLDPYHLKNFQSLFSAIDPAAVDAIEVFSGGFPVNYGTRSGGVINISPPSAGPGYENRVSASLISAGVSSIGTAENLPLEWFGAIRRSTLDLLEPIEDDLGSPRFGDSLGRLRYKTENGAWTAGWLLLDDQLELGGADDNEIAEARYRDEYFWLARDHRFSDTVKTRFATVVSTAERRRSGDVNIPGVVVASLRDSQRFDRFELTNDWTYVVSDASSFAFGGEFSISKAVYEHLRDVNIDPGIAAVFGRAPEDSLQVNADPEVVAFSLYAANRRKWSRFEAEFGLRLDAQDYEERGQHSQWSPRLNLRYDLSPRTRLYASAGRFTQAQHVEEWRVEEGQVRSDPAQTSIHSILGITRDAGGGVKWSVEAYNKDWTRVSPYFDNLLSPLALLPELAPDRIRIAPSSSEAAGLEFNIRAPVRDRMNAWGSLSWSRVADDFDDDAAMEEGDVLRSWDQSMAVTAGLAWEGSRLSLSASGGWHRGWPRTPYELLAPSGGAPGTLNLARRNSDRWADYFTLDLKSAWRWRMRGGEFISTLELTNSTNRSNPCCANFEGVAPGEPPRIDTDAWLPLTFNLGFVYRWRRN